MLDGEEGLKKRNSVEAHFVSFWWKTGQEIFSFEDMRMFGEFLT